MTITVCGFPTVDLTSLSPCEDVVIRLPSGLLLHLEYLEGEKAGISAKGYMSEKDMSADEHYRQSGFEPRLRAFHEIIPDAVLRSRA